LNEMIINNENTSIQNNDNSHSLFDIFSKLKLFNQKRAYQFIKMILQLFTNCKKAYNLLQTDEVIKRRWTHAVRWLREQFERSNNIPSNYTYYQSQGQITSNDMSQGCFLERTASAKSVLEKANDLCSDKENDDVSNSDDIDDDESIDQQILPRNQQFNRSNHHNP